MPANSTDNNVAVNYSYENQAKASEYAGVCVLDEYPWFGRKGMCYDLQVEDPISLVDLPPLRGGLSTCRNPGSFT